MRFRRRSGSFSSPNMSGKNFKFNMMGGSPRYSESPKHSPSVDARLGNNQSLSPNQVPMPVQAELCLEYMWTENSGNQKFVWCDIWWSGKKFKGLENEMRSNFAGTANRVQLLPCSLVATSSVRNIYVILFRLEISYSALNWGKLTRENRNFW